MALSGDGEGGGIHTVELYRKVRLTCREGMSERAAARHFGVSRESVRKMLRLSVPPGYRRTVRVRRPKLDGFTELIDQWLEEDRTQPRKQRHSAKRVFDRLRAEYAFSGSYTIVKDYVREHRRRRRELFVPLAHPPGHAQADFGEARVVIGGVEQKAHFFAFDLPHSDACYVRIANKSEFDGEITITAYDDEGTRYDGTVMSLGAGEAFGFSAYTLHRGHPGHTGIAGVGDPTGWWRLVLTNDVELDAGAYARTPGGFVTATHATVPRARYPEETDDLNPSPPWKSTSSTPPRTAPRAQRKAWSDSNRPRLTHSWRQGIQYPFCRSGCDSLRSLHHARRLAHAVPPSRGSRYTAGHMVGENSVCIYSISMPKLLLDPRHSRGNRLLTERPEGSVGYLLRNGKRHTAPWLGFIARSAARELAGVRPARAPDPHRMD